MNNGVIGIIFNSDKTKVLCVKRRDVPVWVLPGGGVDPSESPETAVIRELEEETGLKTAIVRKVGEYTPINWMASYTEVFECGVISGTATPTVETLLVAYHPIDDLPNNFFFLHREWLLDALGNQTVVRKPIASINYWNLVKHVLRHPVWVLRMALSRFGRPINS